MQSLRPFSILQTSTRQTLASCRHASPPSRRTFFPGFSSGPQTLNASRTLPYPPSTIYSIISDVSKYSQFLPYCQKSLVTKTSQPAQNGQTYPEEAKLSIGFTDGVSEEFYSRIYCIPERVVEAVGGATETAFSGEQIAHHSARPATASDPTRNASVLSHLSTRWTIRPVRESTEVNLEIEYQFTNPMYGALSSAAAPMVADKMIDAFEKRVKSVAAGGV